MAVDAPCSDAPWSHVAAERRALADLLDTLAPAEWEVPTLCRAWRVRDVVAHVVHGPTEPHADTLRNVVAGASGSTGSSPGAPAGAASGPGPTPHARLDGNRGKRIRPLRAGSLMSIP